MKKAILFRVKSYRAKIYAAQIDINNKKQTPTTKILIEIPTSDFDYNSLQIDDEVSKNNVTVELEGYMFTSEGDSAATREAKTAVFDEYIDGANSD